MTHELDELRRQSDSLDEAGEDESAEVVEVNARLFAAEPSNRDACNRLGIALVNQGRLEDAHLVFSEGLAANPANAVGQSRLERIELKLAQLPERSAAEIVDGALADLEQSQRAASLRFMAASIRQIQGIDNEALAVFESPGRHGFRIWGGMVTACAPNGRCLNVMLYEVGARELIDRIVAEGGEVEDAARIAVPTGMWVAVPVSRLDSFSHEIIEAHRRHLVEAIRAGLNFPHLARNRVDLRDYILGEADAAGGSEAAGP